MRVELERLYHGEQLWIETADNKRLDAMLITKQESSARDATGNSSQTDLGTTVVFCNPNAGYYEYSHDFQDQWVEFYTSRGLSLFLWNYRGYGRSQGSPSAQAVMEDGERVLKYLREERGVRRVVVHGESLGGAVAVHLAKKCGCDFLFADRTFSDLEDAAEATAGDTLKRMFNLVTGWTFGTTDKFLQTSCYKVLGNDPCDGTIHNLASLKTGISRAIVPKLSQYRMG